MIVKIIGCMSLNHVIGYKNTIPWYIPQDLKYFKAKTLNYPIIMGKNTFLSIGKPLKNRLNIIISSNMQSTSEYIVFKTLEDALMYLNDKFDCCYIIGGEQLYRKAITIADSILLTVVHERFKGDRFFPRIPIKFKIISKVKVKTNNHKLTFYVYDNQHLNFLQFLWNRIKYMYK